MAFVVIVVVVAFLHYSNISSETIEATGRIKVKFHVEHPLDGGMKRYTFSYIVKH